MSPFLSHGSILAAILLSSVILGGGIYECIVIDPFWPKRPDLIQPVRGGISRGRFWLPLHTLFEITLIVCLVQAWSFPNVRFWLLMALASHTTARIWSAVDFIPKALAFERAPTVDETSARRWTMRSRFRIPIALLTLLLLLGAAGTVISR